MYLLSRLECKCTCPWVHVTAYQGLPFQLYIYIYICIYIYIYTQCIYTCIYIYIYICKFGSWQPKSLPSRAPRFGTPRHSRRARSYGGDPTGGSAISFFHQSSKLPEDTQHVSCSGFAIISTTYVSKTQNT